MPFAPHSSLLTCCVCFLLFHPRQTSPPAFRSDSLTLISILAFHLQGGVQPQVESVLSTYSSSSQALASHKESTVARPQPPPVLCSIGAQLSQEVASASALVSAPLHGVPVTSFATIFSTAIVRCWPAAGPLLHLLVDFVTPPVAESGKAKKTAPRDRNRSGPNHVLRGVYFWPVTLPQNYQRQECPAAHQLLRSTELKVRPRMSLTLTRRVSA